MDSVDFKQVEIVVALLFLVDGRLDVLVQETLVEGEDGDGLVVYRELFSPILLIIIIEENLVVDLIKAQVFLNNQIQVSYVFTFEHILELSLVQSSQLCQTVLHILRLLDLASLLVEVLVHDLRNVMVVLFFKRFQLFDVLCLQLYILDIIIASSKNIVQDFGFNSLVCYSDLVFLNLLLRSWTFFLFLLGGNWCACKHWKFCFNFSTIPIVLWVVEEVVDIDNWRMISLYFYYLDFPK